MERGYLGQAQAAPAIAAPRKVWDKAIVADLKSLTTAEFLAAHPEWNTNAVSNARNDLSIRMTPEARRRAYESRNDGSPIAPAATSKILLFDIEACDLSADNGYTFTFGYKWLGEPDAHTLSLLDFKQARRSDDSGLMKAVYAIISEADVLVGWYSKGYDIKYLNSRMIIAGLPVLPPVPHVDLYFTAKFQLKLRSNRLASVQDFLQLEESKTRLDMRLWMVARDGELKERKAALAYIDEHCRRDVLVLEQAYLKLRPLVRTHPNMGATNGGCRVCGETKSKHDGKQIVGNRVRERRQCSNCSARRFA